MHSLASCAGGDLRQVIIAGRRGAQDTEALLDAAAAPFAPDKALILIDPGDEGVVGFWRAHNPEALAMVEGAGAGQLPEGAPFVCTPDCVFVTACMDLALESQLSRKGLLPLDLCAVGFHLRGSPSLSLPPTPRQVAPSPFERGCRAADEVMV